MTIPCELRVCPSGCVHMRFGPVTVHLGPRDFAEFVRSANQLVGQLPRQMEKRPPAPDELIH